MESRIIQNITLSGTAVSNKKIPYGQLLVAGFVQQT